MPALQLDNLDKSTWQTFRFEQIARSIGERVEPSNTDLETYVGLEHIDPESIHIKRFGTKADVSGTKLRCYPGDVIFGRRRAYQRKAAICEFDGFCSAHSLVLRANPKVIDPKLFPFFLHSDTFMHRAVDISVGSLSPTINWTTLKTQEFLLPPKDQQAKLAELLWAADAAVEATLEMANGCEIARREFIAEAFDKRRDHLVRLQDVADVRYGLTLNSNRKALPVQRPYLRVANVGREAIDLSELKEVGVTEDEIETYRLKSGDVLVVEGHANIQEIGRSAVWRNGAQDVLHQNHLIRIRCRDGVNPRFLSAYINGPSGKGYFQGMAKSTSGLNTINSTVVKELKIPAVERSDQDLFVSRLNLLERTSAEAAQLELSSKALLKSLINQIF